MQGFRWSPDGSAIAYLAAADDAPGGEAPQIADDPARLAQLWLMDLGSKQARHLGTPGYRIANAQWQDHHNRLYRLSSGRAPERIDLPRSVDSFDVAPDGRIAFAGGDFDSLAEIYQRTVDGRVRQLTHLQQGWDQVPLAAAALFHTRSFDGTDIEAALLKPSGERPRGGWPLVLLVHGGPAGNFTAAYGWGSDAGVTRLRGPAGQSARLKRATARPSSRPTAAIWGGGDYRDLKAVLDAVIARGETDSGRLGNRRLVLRWRGMSIWATTQSDRFKAAVVGAPVSDQTAEFESEDGPAGDEWYFGTPWEHPRTPRP